jgi:hypothetical protein
MFHVKSVRFRNVMARTHVTDEGDGLQVRRIAANMLISRGQPTRDGPHECRMSGQLTNPHRENQRVI